MKWLKVGAVVFVSVAITALGIDAADTLDGSRSTLLGQLIATDGSNCPDGMIEVGAIPTITCVDQYEASPDPDCPHPNPNNLRESQENVSNPNCEAVSVVGATPWRFVTREQAATACLRSGKRLISSEEWFMIAAGTPDSDACNIDSQNFRLTGQDDACISAVGVHDTIGNVWEWTSDDVIEGQYNGRPIPEAGYVTQVDSSGFPTLTNVESSGLFYDDYFWASQQGAFGVLRGGYFGSKSDAGLYAIHAKTAPTNASPAIGFRCVL